MSYEALRYQCRKGCEAAFLTPEARAGHEHIHGEDGGQEVITGP